jgi:glycosyltransferase involved in cell wall biosynthesis
MEPVSVVIPTYNRADLLPQTLASVVAAIAECDEIIVADDGSTDGTAEVVCATEVPWHGRVRYLALPKLGPGRSHNAGVAAARHDLVAFADSDDLWLPCRLALERPLMESERTLGFCFSDFGQLFPDGTIVPHWLVQWTGDERSWNEILGPGCPYSARWPLPPSIAAEQTEVLVHTGSLYRGLLHRGYVNVNTLLARRSVVGEALHFGEDLGRYVDWECVARMSRVSHCAYLDVDTALQRAHDGPRLTGSGTILAARARVKLIERTYASDPAFMQAHGSEVREVIADLKRKTLRGLILRNHREEAREMLPSVDGAWLERAALMVPNGLLVAFRRMMGRDR